MQSSDKPLLYDVLFLLYTPLGFQSLESKKKGKKDYIFPASQLTSCVRILGGRLLSSQASY